MRITERLSDAQVAIEIGLSRYLKIEIRDY